MSTQRDYFYPNTEPLAAGEMRITALGTGRPFVRRGQANCSWLIELGNGDKFVMDFGSGSQANFTALEIPHQDVTAYFATHLHADHVGDFAQVWCDYAFYIGNTFSHCGVDAFQLHKQKDGWKIFHLADTRRTENCTIPKSIQQKHTP